DQHDGLDRWGIELEAFRHRPNEVWGMGGDGRGGAEEVSKGAEFPLVQSQERLDILESTAGQCKAPWHVRKPPPARADGPEPLTPRPGRNNILPSLGGQSSHHRLVSQTW